MYVFGRFFSGAKDVLSYENTARRSREGETLRRSTKLEDQVHLHGFCCARARVHSTLLPCRHMVCVICPCHRAASKGPAQQGSPEKARKASSLQRARM